MSQWSSDDCRYFLRQAYDKAWRLSNDPDTKVGAVILRVGKALSYGANKFPTDIAVTPERQKRPDKYDYMIHAEEDAIVLAAKHGRMLMNATMFCPWAACSKCARMIIESGITEVITHKPFMDRTPERWSSDFKLSYKLFDEAGVNVWSFDGEIGEVEAITDGVIWTP